MQKCNGTPSLIPLTTLPFWGSGGRSQEARHQAVVSGVVIPPPKAYIKVVAVKTLVDD